MINFLKPKVIILIFFSFYGQLVSAGKVTIAVDEKNIELGSSVNLSISVTGDLEKEVELPTIDGLSVHGSGSSTNVSWINGTYSKTVSYNFYLTPEKLGRIQIPPLEFKIDGRVEKTRSIYLNVSKAGQQIDSPTEDDSAPLAFIKEDLSKDSVYLGESFLSTVKIYSRRPIQEAKSLEEKSPFFRYIDLNQKNLRERVYGETYSVIELKRILIPTSSGTQTLSSIPIKLALVMPDKQRNNRRDFFSDFFDNIRQTVIQKTIASKENIVKVKPLPALNKPRNFSGLVGKFSMRSDLSNRSLKVGETTTLTIEFYGSGLLDSLSNIDLKLDPSVKVYADKPEAKDSADASRLVSSKKIYKFAVVPTRPGTINLGVFKESYFDPKKEKYMTLSSDLGKIEVTGSMEDTAFSRKNAPLQKTVRAVGSDLIDIKRSFNPYYGKFKDSDIKLIGVLFSLPLLIFLLIVLYLNFLRKSSFISPRLRRQRAYKVYKQKKEEVLKVIQSDDSQSCLLSLDKAYRTFIGDKMGRNGSSLTSLEIQKYLESVGLSQNLLDEAYQLTKSMDQLSFGRNNFDHEQKKNLIDCLDKVVTEIEKRLR